MSRSKEELEQIVQLGSQKTQYIYDYDPKLLERFTNKHPEADYMVMLNCPEFTSLCPKTGQPDFAEIRIAYIPDQFCFEAFPIEAFPQPRRLPRGLLQHHQERLDGASGAALS